jgi:hypothetical protein
MGLFHYKMAMADYIDRVYVHPKEFHLEDDGVYRAFERYFPDHTGKLDSNPGFTMMHDGIDYVLTSSILSCAVEATGMESMEAFQAKKLLWNNIETLAQKIYDRLVANEDLMEHLDVEMETHRDNCFRNWALFRRDALLYRVMAHAMNQGMIGLVEDGMSIWALLFKGAGKHKYAGHTMKVLSDLRSYPKGLAQVIRLNWLINLKGKEGEFRPVDWVVELNNFYIKVSYDIRNAMMAYSPVHREYTQAGGQTILLHM